MELMLVAWLGFSFVFAFLMRRRPLVSIGFILLLRLMIPAVAAGMFTGLRSSSPIGFHPASWLALAVFVMMLLTAPRKIGAQLTRHPFIVLSIGVFAVGCVWTNLMNGHGSMRLLTDQVIAPVLVAVMILTVCTDLPQVHRLRNLLLVAAALQSLLSFLQLATGSVIFFESAYRTIYWFKPERMTRWMGTTDSQLLLALLLSVAAALALGCRHVTLRFLLLALFAGSTLVTQSRTGAFIIVLLTISAIVVMRMNLLAKFCATLGVLLGVAALYALGFTQGLSDRLADDTGSTDARRTAVDFFMNNLMDFLGSGSGLGSSYNLARNAGLETSLESSFLMYAVDVGLVLALIYFATIALIVVRYGLFSRAKETVIAAAVCLVSVNVSSALAYGNFSGMLMWVILALVIASARPPRTESASTSSPVSPEEFDVRSLVES